jgi:hypothetical protein
MPYALGDAGSPAPVPVREPLRRHEQRAVQADVAAGGRVAQEDADLAIGELADSRSASRTASASQA